MAAIGDVNKDGYPGPLLSAAGRRRRLRAERRSRALRRLLQRPGRDVGRARRAVHRLRQRRPPRSPPADGKRTAALPQSRPRVGGRHRAAPCRRSRWRRRSRPRRHSPLAISNGDGRVDIVARGPSGLTVWRTPAAAERDVARASRLTSRVSNRSAVGAKIEMRAGSLRQQHRNLRRHPGAGRSGPALRARRSRRRGRGARAVAVGHPAGRDRRRDGGKTAAGPVALLPPGAMTIEELDRKPSSCPFLYTWNGERFDVHHGLPRRRRDGLLAWAWREEHAGSRRVRAHRRRASAAAQRPLRAAHHERARRISLPRSRAACRRLAPAGRRDAPERGPRSRSRAHLRSSRRNGRNRRSLPVDDKGHDLLASAPRTSIDATRTDSPWSGSAATPPITHSI